MTNSASLPASTSEAEAAPARRRVEGLVRLFTRPLSRSTSLGLSLVAVVVGIFPFLFSTINGTEGDLPLYGWYSELWRSGKTPYVDFVVEYPPLFLALLALPTFVWHSLDFRVVFALEMWALDALGKVLWQGRRQFRDARALLPLALVAACGGIIEYIYLKRFDVAPAMLVLAALVSEWNGASFGAGLLLALGIGTKLYPVVLLPALVPVAWRRGRLTRFVLGLSAGLAPLALLGLKVPWWNFLAFHTKRGLQVESFTGAALWLLHRWTGATCAELPTYFEVAGSAAEALVTPSKVWWVVATGLSGAVVFFRGLRAPPTALSDLAQRALVVLLAFVTFNVVFSPQFHVWLFTVAALTLLGRNWWLGLVVLVATALVPAFFPSPTYGVPGLDPLRAFVVVLRNVILATTWVYVFREEIRGFARQTLQ